FCPPVFQVAFGVELAPLVVEAVREFVANGSSGIAIVWRIVEFRIEQWRLKHAGRKIDVVHLRIVISIDRGRRHLPLPAIDRLTHLIDLTPTFKLRSARDVSSEIVAGDANRTVIAPLLRMTDFVSDAD